MFEFLKKEHSLLFVGGAVSGLALLQFLKSKTFHNMAVTTVSKGISLKDCAMEEYQNIKDEAEDICAEAKCVAREKQDLED